MDEISPAVAQDNVRPGAALAKVDIGIAAVQQAANAVKRASARHPHGHEPRMLVFKQELDALHAAIEDLSSDANAPDYGVVLNAKAVAAELAELKAVVAVAIAEAPDSPLAALLNKIVSHQVTNPADFEDFYYPVTIEGEGDLRPGDVLFDYEQSSVVGTVGKLTPLVDAFATSRQPTCAVMRSFGHDQPRIRLASARSSIKALVTIEGTRFKKDPHDKLSQGRVEGLTFALNTLSLPVYEMPPVKLAPAVESPAEEPAHS